MGLSFGIWTHLLIVERFLALLEIQVDDIYLESKEKLSKRPNVMVEKGRLESILLCLDDPDDLSLLQGSIKFAPGLLPGVENDGMKANSCVRF